MNRTRIIGSCSKCGGYVSVPEVWMGVNPPIPTCNSCGATKKEKLPVIEMNESPIKKELLLS